MTIKKTIKREFKVAFSKNAQPIWFRIIKWVVYIGLAYLLYETKWFWIWGIGLPIAALTMHFIYRWKTKGWTKSWRGWDSKTGEWKPQILGSNRKRK